MNSETRLKKGEKPRVITFSPHNKCCMWRLKWAANGFTPIVLPADGGKDFAQRMNDAAGWLRRIQARPNAPSLDGYLRWIATTLYAQDTQYVFMTQPDIFPGDLQNKGLLTEEMCRHSTAQKLCLLAGSDAVMGTKASFIRMCDLLVADGGVTDGRVREEHFDRFIVRRVQDQMMDFIVDLPNLCKDHGEDGWDKAPLVRMPIGSGAVVPDVQAAIMEMSK